MVPYQHQHGDWPIAQNVAFASLLASGLSFIATLIRTMASLNLQVSNGHHTGDPGHQAGDPGLNPMSKPHCLLTLF